jgi:predicted enzyme related to lactoylglutathione lyase
LGISYRSIKNYRKAIEFFEKALKWAKERKVTFFIDIK